MEYVKRTSSPSYTDKFWIHTSSGGLNSCILISDGSVLANCVGYAWGRAYELLNSKPKLSRANAEDWYAYNDGYERGQTPRVGSIVCWRKGDVRDDDDGAGHVAVVEEVYSDGSILTSNSSYKGTRFWTKKYSNDYNMGTNYIFQGFIYLPIDVETNVSSTTKSITELAAEVLEGVWGNNPERKEALEATGYDYTAVQTEVNNLISGKASTDEKIYYKVLSGDTLSKIASKYNITWQQIYKDNIEIIGDNPNYIKIGQELVLNVLS